LQDYHSNDVVATISCIINITGFKITAVVAVQTKKEHTVAVVIFLDTIVTMVDSKIIIIEPIASRSAAAAAAAEATATVTIGIEITALKALIITIAAMLANQQQNLLLSDSFQAENNKLKKKSQSTNLPSPLSAVATVIIYPLLKHTHLAKVKAKTASTTAIKTTTTTNITIITIRINITITKQLDQAIIVMVAEA